LGGSQNAGREASAALALDGAADDGGVAFAFAGEHDDEASGFVDVHRGVVDDDGVGGADQGRDLAFAVPFVALAHFLEHLEDGEMVALFLVLFPAALGANFWRSFEKNLQLGIRKNDSADVAAFHHDATARAGALLLGDEDAADSGDRSEAGCGLRDVGGANGFGNFDSVEVDAILAAGDFLLGRGRFEFDVSFGGELFQLSFVAG